MFLYFTQQCLFFDAEAATTLLGINRTGDGIGNHRYRLHHLSNSGRTLDGVVLGSVEQDMRLETDEILLVLFDILLNLSCVVLACETVGVILGRQQQHLDVQSLGQQHVHAPECGMHTSIVAVEHFGHILCEAVNEMNVPLGQGRSRRRNHILESCLVHRNHVGISLHDVAFVLLGNLTLGLEQAVHGTLPLAVDQ